MKLTRLKVASLFIGSILLGALPVAAGQNAGPQPASEGGRASADSDVPRITVDELMSKLARSEPVVIIDARGSDYDASDSRIKGAVRIPPAEMKSRIGEIPRDKEIVTYCACPTDGGAVGAARVLLDNGFKHVRALKGGWNAWRQVGGPVEPKEKANK